MSHSLRTQIRRSLAGLTDRRRNCLVRNVIAALLVAAAAVPIAGDEAARDEQKLSVPVRVIAAVAEPPAEEMEPQPNPQPAPPQPTTPGGRLPQYQLHHHRRVDDAGANDSRIRIILALPEQPILVQATITVDGKPFRQLREDRVAEILKFAADPAAWQAQAEQTAAAIATTGAGEGVGELAAETQNSTRPDEERPADDAADSDPDGTSATEGNGDDQKNKSADAESEADDEQPAAGDEAAESGDGESAQKDDTPAIPAYTAPDSVYERVRRYMDATGEPPTSEEVRWLLTNWVDGPVLLYLNNNFQRFRADQTPVFKVLDRDRDGLVSAEELKMAVTSFQECDLNRNDIVEHTEIGEVANDPRDTVQHAGPGKLVFTLPDVTTAASVYQRLAAQYAVLRFDTNSDGRFDADEIAVLHDSAPDIALELAFNTTDPGASRLTVSSIAESFRAAADGAQISDRSLTLQIGKNNVDFSAVQTTDSDQIAIGAVNDGYPILPVVDPNDDGRFTIRELRQLNDLLIRFDQDGDGTLTADETRSTVRLCIGLGPIVHQELAALRSTQPVESPAAVTGPGWFRQMDVNKDNDLTRKEFPGTDEQYALLDIDGDELVSAAEANRFSETQSDDRAEAETDDSGKNEDAAGTEDPPSADTESS